MTDSESVAGNVLLTAIMFLFLLAFGSLFDRYLYRRRLRKWEEKRGIRRA